MGRRKAGERTWQPVAELVCEYCDARFQRVGSRDSHVRNKHQAILERQELERVEAERRKLLEQYDQDHPVRTKTVNTLPSFENAPHLHTTSRFADYLAPFIEDSADDVDEETLADNGSGRA